MYENDELKKELQKLTAQSSAKISELEKTIDERDETIKELQKDLSGMIKNTSGMPHALF